MTFMRVLDRIALIILIVGGLNWGLVGIFKFDLVKFITAESDVFSNIIYSIVGIAAVWCISLLFRPDNDIT